MLRACKERGGGGFRCEESEKTFLNINWKPSILKLTIIARNLPIDDQNQKLNKNRKVKDARERVKKFLPGHVRSKVWKLWCFQQIMRISRMRERERERERQAIEEFVKQLLVVMFLLRVLKGERKRSFDFGWRWLFQVLSTLVDHWWNREIREAQRTEVNSTGTNSCASRHETCQSVEGEWERKRIEESRQASKTPNWDLQVCKESRKSGKSQRVREIEDRKKTTSNLPAVCHGALMRQLLFNFIWCGRD